MGSEYEELMARLHSKEQAADKQRDKAAKLWKVTPRQEEHDLQVECVNWFRKSYEKYSQLFFAVPNGGSIGQSRSKKAHEAAGAKRKAEGVLAGVSDLILLVPSKGYFGLCIEMKIDSSQSRLSDSQKQFRDNVTMQGYKYVVPRTLEQFQKEIGVYLD